VPLRRSICFRKTRCFFGKYTNPKIDSTIKMQVLNIEAICTYSKPSKELTEMTDPFFHLLTNSVNILPDPVRRYNDWLRAGRSGDRILVGARFSAPVQTGPGARPASCTMSTDSFLGPKSGRGVTLTPHPNLVPWSRKGTTIPLRPLWAVRPVQSLSACTRVHFTFFTRSCGTSI